MAIKGSIDGLDVFNYAGEPILPEQDSYQVGIISGAVYSETPGGMTKSSLAFFNQPYTVNVTYQGLDAFKLDYIQNFLIANNGQKFVASLMIEQSNLEQYVVQMLGDFEVSKTGFNGSISVSFEVDPAIDQCFVQVIRDWGLCVGNPSQTWCYTDMAIGALP